MQEMHTHKIMGVSTIFSEISCVVEHAKLPNLVIIAVVGFICFWIKIKAFRPLEEDAVMKFNFNGSIK